MNGEKKQYTVNEICKYVKKYGGYLAELIAYYSGKHSLLNNKNSKKNIGLKKESVKKLPVLLKIFNKYCEFEEIQYKDDFGKYKDSNLYYVKGNIPNKISNEIVREYEKNEDEDYHSSDENKDELYEELMK